MCMYICIHRHIHKTLTYVYIINTFTRAHTYRHRCTHSFVHINAYASHNTQHKYAAQNNGDKYAYCYPTTTIFITATTF